MRWETGETAHTVVCGRGRKVCCARSTTEVTGAIGSARDPHGRRTQREDPSRALESSRMPSGVLPKAVLSGHEPMPWSLCKRLCPVPGGANARPRYERTLGPGPCCEGAEWSASQQTADGTHRGYGGYGWAGVAGFGSPWPLLLHVLLKRQGRRRRRRVRGKRLRRRRVCGPLRLELGLLLTTLAGPRRPPRLVVDEVCERVQIHVHQAHSPPLRSASASASARRAHLPAAASRRPTRSTTAQPNAPPLPSALRVRRGKSRDPPWVLLARIQSSPARKGAIRTTGAGRGEARRSPPPPRGLRCASSPVCSAGRPHRNHLTSSSQRVRLFKDRAPTPAPRPVCPILLCIPGRGDDMDRS